MRKKKFIAMALVAMLSLSGLTGCSDKDKADISNKLNNKTTETTKKDDSKADDKTSESKPDNKSDNKTSDSNSDKPDNKPSKPNGNTGSNKPSNGSSNSSNSSTSKPSQSTEKPAETKPSQPAHQHTWVDHTATKTVHHDAVYEEVTIPAVTQTQHQCLGCGKWFSSKNDLLDHAFLVQIGQAEGDPARCGSSSYDAVKEVVITPAKTERQLVQDAWDETQTYVDYQYCSGCGQHK